MEGSAMEATVSEIHAYPLRPEGYAEPLFHDYKSRREILEHLARSGWLWRASEAPRPACQAPERGPHEGAGKDGRVIASWREVDRWWEPGGGVDLVWRRVEDRRGRQTVLAKPPSAGSAQAA